MGIKRYSFSEIEGKAKELSLLWQNISFPELPSGYLAQSEFAPLIATICDEQVNSKDAVNFPQWLNDKVKEFNLPNLLGVDYKIMLKEYFKDKWPRGMKENKKQEYIEKISKALRDALEFFQKEGKSPVTIFENREYKALEIYFMLRRIPGFGHKKANMITRDFIYRSLGFSKSHSWFDQIKARAPEFKVIEGNLLDMPVDVHVIKVFNRIFGRKFPAKHKGKRNKWQDELQEHLQDILAFSKLVFPELPVKLDQIFWTVGHKYCHQSVPNCRECPIAKICDSKTIK